MTCHVDLLIQIMLRIELELLTLESSFSFSANIWSCHCLFYSHARRYFNKQHLAGFPVQLFLEFQLEIAY